MTVAFLRKFSKDIDAINSQSIKDQLLTLIELIESTDSLKNIPNLKKLKGHKSAYRIRIGDYRLGFFYENNVVLMARFVHRKDIYNLFP